MCGVARDTAAESDIVPPLEAAMPPSVTLGSDPPKPAAGPGDHPPQQESSASKDIPTIDLSCDENDDLQKAIALSLQDQQSTTTIQGVSAEDQEVSRALEASLKDSRPQTTIDLLNPQERKRKPGVPVGLKNIGNSCWFNVIIQPLFHIPLFRKLIVSYPPDTEELLDDSQKSSHLFAPALRKLFALMLGSDRKYIDPTAAVNIFQGQEMMRKNAQQDVCEFTHKLLERLEEEFLVLLRKNEVEKESSECHVSKGANFDNPMVKLFYGQSRKEACDEEDGPKEETFGQYPLHVMNYVDIHDSILASMACPPSMLGDTAESAVKQETWFKMLPPVLIFSLSRYEYSHKKKRAEKVHNKFEFPEFLYMDRYMEENKKIVKEKHIKVAKLRSELNSLTKTLDKYQKYGTGEAKYPIGDILKYTLDFAQTGLNPGQETEAGCVPSPSSMMEVDGVEACENDVEMTDPADLKKPVKEESKENKVAVLVKEELAQNDVILKEDLTDGNTEVEEVATGSLCISEREPEEEPQQVPSPSKRMRILPPVPRNISTSELSILQSCLSRWLQDINSQVTELRHCISELEQQLHQVYDEPCLKRIPYRLHAVVVHEGQASGGHYWVYTFDTVQNTWMKFNDIQVVESNWEELLQDSIGGQNNASAYCLFYIDEATRKSLFYEPAKTIETKMASLAIDLQDYVKADNMAFLRELQEWDMKQENTDQVKETGAGPSQEQQGGGETWDMSPQIVPVTAPNSPDIICIQEADENNFFTEVETMLSQTIKDALVSGVENSVQSEHGSLLNTILCNEFCRLRSFADTSAENNPYSEPSILDFGVYLIRNKQNVESLLRWYGCEVVLQVTHNINEPNSVVKRLTLEAGQYLQQMKEQMQHSEGLEYHGWLKHYRTLLECAWQLVLGHRHYEKGNFERALPHLLRACRTHQELKDEPPEGNRKTLNKQVLWKCRRSCFLALNEKLIERFWNGEEDQLEEIPGNVNSLVVPALAQLNACGVDEDRTVEVVRKNWCQLLEKEIPSGKKCKVREQILLGILNTGGDNKGTMPLQTPRHPSVLPLYKQYVEACKSIMSSSNKPKAQTSDL